MSVRRPTAGRLKPVRLTDIPVSVRTDAAHREIRKLQDPDGPERDELMLAALLPSSRVYWVRA